MVEKYIDTFFNDVEVKSVVKDGVEFGDNKGFFVVVREDIVDVEVPSKIWI